MILVANTSFPELDHLSAGLAEAGLLSVYVRPYANVGRKWEHCLATIRSVAGLYERSLGRRRMPSPLSASHVREAGIAVDLLMAAQSRLPTSVPAYRAIRNALVHARNKAVAQAAAQTFRDERVVIASWGCAASVFRKAKARGAMCILNYSLAHHRFTRRYLLEEAERHPDFAETLTSHNRPVWFEQQLDVEIDLADRILVGSSFVRDSFIEEGVPAHKLVVIPYGADTRLFEPPQRPRPFGSALNLLFVGQISQRKGISYLLTAMRTLRERGDRLTMVGQIQGSGRALAPYRPLFRHVPHMPRIKLREVYQEADAFVFPTLIEGMPLVVLEAMASGLPVITTPNGPGDIVRDGVDGLIVPPRDASAIIESLERLRREPAMRIEMGRNARERARRYTWAAYRLAILEYLQKCLSIEARTVVNAQSKSNEYRYS